MITASQLPDSAPTYVVLHCAACGSDYSATRGDYFLANPGESLRCECQMPLFIATRSTVYNHDNGQQWLKGSEKLVAALIQARNVLYADDPATTKAIVMIDAALAEVQD